ncbi:hypothetical protein QUF84_00110 [Fictibacillus enclensis]|uniref:hypothetical protein n=1 Tax=Fictibacillus enclensis TaxID=1017270 RepID=UPI0025A1C437|nr:hypothetical protein [Fictibacillus enclensis]MDM5335699.1 hypothetical protein [Fictibacillus enclensis]
MEEKKTEPKRYTKKEDHDIRSNAIREYYLLDESMQYDRPNWEHLYFTRFQRMFWGRY